jgi:hypothetical protein
MVIMLITFYTLFYFILLNIHKVMKFNIIIFYVQTLQYINLIILVILYFIILLYRLVLILELMGMLMLIVLIIYCIFFICFNLNIIRNYNIHIDKFNRENKEMILDFEFIQFEIVMIFFFIKVLKFEINIIDDEFKVIYVQP